MCSYLFLSVAGRCCKNIKLKVTREGKVQNQLVRSVFVKESRWYILLLFYRFAPLSSLINWFPVLYYVHLDRRIGAYLRSCVKKRGGGKKLLVTNLGRKLIR